MKLLEFLSLLATDTECMSAFRKTPKDTLIRAGVSEEDQHSILAGDPVALRKAVYAEQISMESPVQNRVMSGTKPEVWPEPQPPGPPRPEVWPEPHPPRPEVWPEPLPPGRPEMMPIHPSSGPPGPDRPELIAVHPPAHPGPHPPRPEVWPEPHPPRPEVWPEPPGRPEMMPVHPGPPGPDRPELIAVHPPAHPGPHPPELTTVHPPPAHPGPHPPRPEVWPEPEPPCPEPPELTAVHPPPAHPGPPEVILPHIPPAHQSGLDNRPDPAVVESLDPERDLAQDALLAGLKSSRATDADACGVWSSKGLTIVGMGMRAGLHMTVETRLALQQAPRVLYLVADPVSEACIRKLNANAESLGHLYLTGKQRIEIYETIITRILDELESHGELCVAFYGHAGVLTYPAWESIRRARATGKRARMLPAISTEDTLFADLGIDIGGAGLQSFEATRFLYYKYNFDPSAALLLWQISVLGEIEWNPPHAGVRPRLEVLTDYLLRFYPPGHEVFLYHAPEFPTSRPLIERVAVRDLASAEFVSISTLYIPPYGVPRVNEENMQALARIEARK